jgi:hypothetical protein
MDYDNISLTLLPYLTPGWCEAEQKRTGMYSGSFRIIFLTVFLIVCVKLLISFFSLWCFAVQR